MSNSTTAASGASTFTYQIQHSAFKLVEAPMYYCWKAYKGTLYKPENPNQYQQAAVTVLKGVGYIGGLVALPIAFCAAPVTLVADLVIGAAEILYCRYNGLGEEEIKTLAHRKFVVAPLQHLIFMAGVLVIPIVLWLVIQSKSHQFIDPRGVLIITLFFWPICYQSGQEVVGEWLPPHLNDPAFNIFIGGGSDFSSPDEESNKSGKPDTGSYNYSSNFNSYSDFNSDYKSHFNTGREEQKPASNNRFDWNEFIDKEIAYPPLNRLDDPTVSTEYLNFKNRLLKRVSPRELLGLSPNFTEEELKKSYKLYALRTHPDKNDIRKKEAETLFKVLGEAYVLLQKELKRR